jgi:hypothetical protein
MSTAENTAIEKRDPGCVAGKYTHLIQPSERFRVCAADFSLHGFCGAVAFTTKLRVSDQHPGAIRLVMGRSIL